MAKKSKLKIIPLGGLEEIGKNLTVFEYKEDIIVLDCGVAFPDEEMFGIDLVIPDMTYLYKNRDRVRAMVLTHGHEDHIGGIPYFLKEINVPIYGTALTLGILSKKLKEHGLLKQAKQAGCQTFNGLYMLLHQGAKAFHLWTGQDMPVEEIRNKFFL